MGCASSSEPKHGGTPRKSDANRGAQGPQAIRKEKEVDIGLRDTFEYVKPLGQGGTGQTLLYRNKATAELVAIKLIKRPIPKVIMPNILREITVNSDPSTQPPFRCRSRAITSLHSSFVYPLKTCVNTSSTPQILVTCLSVHNIRDHEYHNKLHVSHA